MRNSKKIAAWIAGVLVLAGLAFTAYDIHRKGLFDQKPQISSMEEKTKNPFYPVISCYANKRNAWRAAKKFVEKKLISPATARFSPSPWSNDPDLEVEELERCSYYFKAYVDSQNAFGAMLRTNFVIVVRRLSNGDWSEVKFKIYK